MTIQTELILVATKKFQSRNQKRAIQHEQVKQHLPTDPSIHNTILSIKDQTTDNKSSNLSDNEYDQPLSISALQAAYRENKMTAKDVVTIYSMRAMLAGGLTNCVTEEFYTDAIEVASKLTSSDFAKDKTDRPLLLGIPVGIKDQFVQNKSDATMGLACRCFSPAKEDGLLVALVREAGGIPFCRTNTQQGMLFPESDNQIFGQTCNPYNLERTSGGSTGGGGAILAANASIVELGSDIGGSLRIPATFCGCYAFKPSPNRISTMGLLAARKNNISGNIAIAASAGPMAHHVDDLVLVMRAWLVDRMFKVDTSVPPIPFNMNIYNSHNKRKLKIGYYDDDGWFKSSPASQRAIKQVMQALKEDGHELIAWQPPDVQMAVGLYYGILSADGNVALKAALEGEKFHRYYKSLDRMSRLPSFVRKILAKLLRNKGELRAASIMECIGSKSVVELYDFHVAMKLYITKFKQSWSSSHLDAIICPVNGVPAYQHGMAKDLTITCAYTFLYNLVPFPAGSCPITTVRSDEQHYSDDNFNDRYTKLADQVCQQSEGLPIGVQVVTNQWDDELCLSLMKRIQELCPYKTRSKISQQLNIYA